GPAPLARVDRARLRPDPQPPHCTDPGGLSREMCELHCGYHLSGCGTCGVHYCRQGERECATRVRARHDEPDSVFVGGIVQAVRKSGGVQCRLKHDDRRVVPGPCAVYVEGVAPRPWGPIAALSERVLQNFARSTGGPRVTSPLAEMTEGMARLRRNALPSAPGPHVPTVQSPGVTATGVVGVTRKSGKRPP